MKLYGSANRTRRKQGRLGYAEWITIRCSPKYNSAQRITWIPGKAAAKTLISGFSSRGVILISRDDAPEIEQQYAAGILL